jgi:hypothetical protein
MTIDPREKPMSDQCLVIAAVIFIVFWFWTYEESKESVLAYAVRSGVVLYYQYLVMANERPDIGLAEWAANCLVWLHWLGAIQMFLYPDPRYKKKVYD